MIIMYVNVTKRTLQALRATCVRAAVTLHVRHGALTGISVCMHNKCANRPDNTMGWLLMLVIAQ